MDVAPVTLGPGSVEAAAREARYAALEAWADRLGAERIAIGHSADDQAETVLMRLLDGAGVRGLAGIPPRRGRVIRPLIETRRQALRDELAAAGLDWVEDETNRDPKFLRNRIRHELLPLLAASYATDVVPSLARAAAPGSRDGGRARSRGDRRARASGHGRGRRADAVARGARGAALPRWRPRRCVRPPRGFGSRAPLRAWAHRGLRRILAPVSAAPPVPTRRRHGRGQRGPRAGWRGTAATTGLADARRAGSPRPAGDRPGAAGAAGAGGRLCALPRTAECVAFDAAHVPRAILVRPRRAGDRFEAFGGGERRLKSFLIDAKVPRWERPRVPVLEAEGRILWIAGLRRGVAAPVTRDTRDVVEIRLIASR